MSDKKEQIQRGRKFIALVIGVVYAVFYHVTCLMDVKNLELLSFSIVVVSFIAAYMGANTFSKKFNQK